VFLGRFAQDPVAALQEIDVASLRSWIIRAGPLRFPPGVFEIGVALYRQADRAKKHGREAGDLLTT